MKTVPVTNDDRKKSYFKYYEMDMEKGPEEKYVGIKKGPGKLIDAMKIQDRKDLFKEGYLSGEFGYWLMKDGTAVIANLTQMPGVTAEMFDWWFAWHPIDRLRYAIWDAEDHYDVILKDPKLAFDTSKSLNERNWGSIHHIWEDIGTGMDKLIISFKKPSDMGYAMDLIGTKACGTIKCANVIVLGKDHIPDIPVVMTHFLRPVEGGSELRSRFWFGWQIIDGIPVKSIPDGVSIPDIGPVSLLTHNVKEFSNLGKILPLVYAEEKDNL